MKPKNSIAPKHKSDAPPGNRTEGSKNYKDPVGKGDKSVPPQNSGYDEKQPTNDKD